MDVAFSPLYTDHSSTCSPPRPAECRVRRSYTLQYKLEVVKWIEKTGSSLRQASKRYGITRRVIRAWLDQREQLKEALDLNDPNKRKLHGGRPPASGELDKRMLDFLVKQREKEVSVSDSDLRSKALDTGYQLGLSGFKANPSWLRRWKQRCGVEFRNGTNDIVVKAQKLSKSTFLSRIDSSEQIKLVVQQCTSDSLDMGQISQEPVYLDFTTLEHNYCQKGHQPNLFITSSLPGHIDTSEEVGDLYGTDTLHCHQLGSEQDISTLSHSSVSDGAHLLGDLTVQSEPAHLTMSQSSIVDSALDLMIPTSAVVQELVEGLELPLGHEEVVGESSGGKDGELIITQAAESISPTFPVRDNSLLSEQTLSNQEQVQAYFAPVPCTSPPSQPSLLSASLPKETVGVSSARMQDFVSLQSAQDYLLEMNRFLQEHTTLCSGSGGGEVGNSPSTGSKTRASKKRYQPKRGCSRTKGAKTKTKKTGSQRRGREVTPVATFPNLMLDDPQGYSGLLASRLSQPVFPGEPEFVYTDMATSQH